MGIILYLVDIDKQCCLVFNFYFILRRSIWNPCHNANACAIRNRVYFKEIKYGERVVFLILWAIHLFASFFSLVLEKRIVFHVTSSSVSSKFLTLNSYEFWFGWIPRRNLFSHFIDIFTSDFRTYSDWPAFWGKITWTHFLFSFK